MWFRSITTLPLNKFIECSVDNNLAALTISGFPSPSELFASWADIQQEYADTMSTDDHKVYLSMLKEITVLKIKLQMIIDMVDILRVTYYPPFADRLNILLATSFTFDYTNPETYNKELQRCLNRSKGIKIDLDLKELRFSEIKKKNEGKGTVPTREYYQQFLITLSDHAKFQIQDTITVYEFCERVRRYSSYCEQMEKAYKK